MKFKPQKHANPSDHEMSILITDVALVEFYGHFRGESTKQEK